MIKFTLLILTFSMQLKSAELVHYEQLKVFYDDKIYKMHETKLEHNSYKSYTLTAPLDKFKQRNSEGPLKIDFNIGFFNDIQYDTVDQWVASSKKNVIDNQVLKNDLAVFDEGTLGDNTRFIGIAHSLKGDGRADMFEYDVGYIKLGRMMTMQVTYFGDIDNTKAKTAFLSMTNTLLMGIVDDQGHPFTTPIMANEKWKTVKLDYSK